MGKKTPLSPAVRGGGGGGVNRRDDAGGQLLRELEALSQVLYNAGQTQPGRPPRKEAPSSPALVGLRSHEVLSPHLAGRAFQPPPSPRLGSRDSPSEEPQPSPYGGESASAFRRVRSEELPQPRSPYLRTKDGPQSPYLAGLNAPQPEARSPVILSLNGGLGKHPRGEPVSPYTGAAPGYELPKSSPTLNRLSVDSVSLPYIEGRRSETLSNRSLHHPSSPHLRGINQNANNDVGSPSLRTRRSVSDITTSPYMGAMGDDATTNEPKQLGALNITEITLSSAAAALRSPNQRAIATTRSISPLSQSVDTGKRVEPYSLGGGRESGLGGTQNPAALKPWHSQGFDRNSLTPILESHKLPPPTTPTTADITNFSKHLEAPKEKRSLWNWKPFRAIAHIGAQRFNCMFTVHVHGIEGLPAVTNGLRLAVSWKRKEAQAQSMPARVFQGSAEFEESLYLKSTVYGTKDSHKGIKFEPKCFDLSVIALDVDELVLGKHRLDLSRLVPKPGESHEEDYDRSWTTRFKLAGKAKGGTLIVTFACQLLQKNADVTNNLSSARFSDSPMTKPLRSYNSLPSSPEGTARNGWAPPSQPSFFSPAMSEMPIDGEYMSMEHLSLNDELSPARDNSGPKPFSADRSVQKSSQKEESRPSISDSPSPPKELSYNQQAATSERERMRKALSFDDDDDGSEFTVVCQGHESSAICDAAPVVGYDDSTADADVVQGLSDFDGDLHEDSVRGSASPLSYNSRVDAPEVVKFLSEDTVSRNEPADENHSLATTATTSRPRNSPLLQSHNAGDKFPPVPAAPLVNEPLPQTVDVVEVLEVQQKRETDAPATDQKPLNAGAVEEAEEEDIVDVQEDWSVSMVEDLDVLTKAWSVGVPASANNNKNNSSSSNVNIVEEDEICREEFLSDLDKEEEEDEEEEEEEDEEEEEEDSATIALEVAQNTSDHESLEEEKKNLILVETKRDDEEVDEEGPVGDESQDVVPLESNVGKEKDEESIDDSVQSTFTPPSLQPSKTGDAATVEEDDYEDVYGEFMSLLRDPSPPVEHSESGEDSPRAMLLKQFEQEALIEGGLELNFHLPEYAKFRVEGPASQESNNKKSKSIDGGEQPESPVVPGNVVDVTDHSDWDNEDDMELAAIIEAAEAELEKATQILHSKARAKLLEDEETKSLLQQWGLNDTAFEEATVAAAADPSLPAPDSSDLTMAIVPAAAVAPPPPLGHGLGPAIRFRDGSSVRSMSPLRGERGAGQLLMQASNPVVVPAEMGATSMDILRRMAVAGMEGMAAQAMMAMPLEDLTGKALDQLPVQVEPRPAGFSQPLVGSRRVTGFAALGPGENNSNNTTLALLEDTRASSSSLTTSYTLSRDSSRLSKRNGSNPNEDQLHMAALEDLAPMAMLKIEALALEGLKIQAEMAEQDAPYAVEPLAEESLGNNNNNNNNNRIVGGGGGVGIRVAGMAWRSRSSQGVFMSMDEWMRLDAGVWTEDEDEPTEQAVATTTRKQQRNQHSIVRKDGRRGFMDETVTLAMLVHLRDPLRNNEPLGAPMLALVQAERMMAPKRRNSGTGLRRSFSEQEKEPDDVPQPAAASQFKIVDITIAGSRIPMGKENAGAEVWGTQKQLAAGSRWLAAHGMAKSTFRPNSFTSKPAAATKAAANKSALWSLSDRVYGSGARWRAAAAPHHPPIRNPDVLFTDTSIRSF